MGNGLVELLSKEFTQSNGGVHRVFNFDENTFGLRRNDGKSICRSSLMVATGLNKIAVVKTGFYKHDNGNGAFTPTDVKFTKEEINQNVFVFEGDDLQNFGPVCCAELSRIADKNNGWLFVGGWGGLAVLRNSENGNGWDGREDGEDVDFAKFTFKKLNKKDKSSFSQVRKLVADNCMDNQFLYIMTSDKIYRFIMGAKKFAIVPTEQLEEDEILPPPGVLLDMIIYYSVNEDARLLVATTDGLFYSDKIDNSLADKVPTWTKVTVAPDVPLAGPVVHLHFIDKQKGGYTTDGNLYALVADLSLSLATIYRFDVGVTGGDPYINPIQEVGGAYYFYSIGELRNNFVTDGALGYMMLPKHFDKTEFLRKFKMISSQSSIRYDEKSIDLDLDSDSYNVGIMVQNTASGAWVVPGDWGIRVNE